MGHTDGHEAAVGTNETAEGRDIMEIIRTRAHLLASAEKDLLLMYLEQGNRFRQIGRLVGLSRTSVARRIRKISQRLLDDTYSLCLSNHDEFTGRELTMIKDHFIRGLSMKRISRSRNVTLYHVRMVIHKARRYAASARALCP